MKNMSITCFLVLLPTIVFSVDLPSTFPRCYDVTKEEEVPKFVGCVMDAAKKSKDALKNGIPDLKIPPLDSIVIPAITIEQKTRALQYNVSISNVTIKGLENYEMVYFWYVLKNRTYVVTLKMPHIELNGIYDIKGSVFNQFVNQTGNFKASFNDSVVDFNITHVLYKKKGVDYISIVDIDIEPTIGNAVGSFDNLFGENQVLNKATNAFLEDSTNYLIQAAKPDIKNLMAHLIKELAKQISGSVPYYSIFPKSENDS